MITLRDYWMGHDDKYPLAMTPQIEHDAHITVELANEFISHAAAAGVECPKNPETGTQVSSGWRPPAVNAVTPRAAPSSKHMTGQAIDLYGPGNKLATWAFNNQAVLVRLGLWMEHPSATPTWLHLQTIPPKSGSRVFYP